LNFDTSRLATGKGNQCVKNNVRIDKVEMGRRERKKIQLRDALIKASYELFAKKGFDETRIEDITEMVDVSTRTFFRYFPSKEEVVLDYQEAEHRDFMAALIKRPLTEPILTALRHAAVEVMQGCESGSYGFDADRFITLQELLKCHPLVRAKNLRNNQYRKNSMISLIAQRLGVDASVDIRPNIVAGVLDYAHSVAYDIWNKRSSPITLYSDVLNEVFLLIENGLNFPPREVGQNSICPEQSPQTPLRD
jgi:AcrR family transcriptional regulator